MEYKIEKELHKHVKKSILEKDSLNFEGKYSGKDNIYITKHARKRAKERNIDVKDALLNKKKVGNRIKGNKIVTIIGDNNPNIKCGQGQKKTCKTCKTKYMTTYIGKTPICSKCRNKK